MAWISVAVIPEACSTVRSRFAISADLAASAAQSSSERLRSLMSLALICATWLTMRSRTLRLPVSRLKNPTLYLAAM